MTAAGSPHSETLGSKPARRLPEAYRCPPRLSSVPSAKASTIRPCRQPHTRGTRKTKRTPDDRSSTLCDHKTIKQTTRPPSKGTRSKYISTSRPRQATPQRGGHAVRSRPLSSSQTTTPHHTPRPRTPGKEPMAGTRTPTPPHKEGRGGQGTQQHAHTRPHKGGATILPRQHARHPGNKTPGTMPGKQKLSVERR